MSHTNQQTGTRPFPHVDLPPSVPGGTIKVESGRPARDAAEPSHDRRGTETIYKDRNGGARR